ncbi:Alcohol dehydrogenase zinc-binding domain protein [Yersinia frederiksenii ATCC 33641]|nr:Alcohol dehydrogenase zinc-binding domain protein [Yersinia frederiksenii ATCC 33641]
MLGNTLFFQFSEPTPLPGETVINVTVVGIKQLDRAIAKRTHDSSPKNSPYYS